MRTPQALTYSEEIGVAAYRSAAYELWGKLLDDVERAKAIEAIRKDHPEVFEKHEKEHPGEEVLSKQTIQKMLAGDGYELEVDIGKNNVIKSALENVPQLAELFIRGGWNFAFAPAGTEFITSDAPAYAMLLDADRLGALSFKYGGFGREGGYVIMPLAKDICVLIQQGEYYQKSGTTTKAMVENTNRMTAQHHDHFLFAASSAALDPLIPIAKSVS